MLATIIYVMLFLNIFISMVINNFSCYYCVIDFSLRLISVFIYFYILYFIDTKNDEILLIKLLNFVDLTEKFYTFNTNIIN